MKDLFIITGAIDELLTISKKLNGEIMSSESDDNVNYERLQRLAEEAEDVLSTLTDELED